MYCHPNCHLSQALNTCLRADLGSPGPLICLHAYGTVGTLQNSGERGAEAAREARRAAPLTLSFFTQLR